MKIKSDLDKIRDREIEELKIKIDRLEKRIERNYEYYCNHLLREHKKIEGKK